MAIKKCRTCKKDLSLSEFNKDSTRADGYRYVCKLCMKVDRKKRYNTNPEKYRNKSKSWRSENKERYDELEAIWRSKNRQKCIEKSQSWRDENPDKVKNYSRRHYGENKEYYLEKNKRYLEDDKNRVLHNLRVRIPRFIKRDGASKATRELIGCDLDKLMDHLEQQFKNDMSWDNYGEWHIDHIIPVCVLKESDNLKKDAEKIFHYTNLQPLWASENQSKSNKISWQ